MARNETQFHYMFISKYGLFNDVFSTSDYSATNDKDVDGKRIETGVKRSVA
jgi:hypothetical protein